MTNTKINDLWDATDPRLLSILHVMNNGKPASASCPCGVALLCWLQGSMCDGGPASNQGPGLKSKEIRFHVGQYGKCPRQLISRDLPLWGYEACWPAGLHSSQSHMGKPRDQQPLNKVASKLIFLYANDYCNAFSALVPILQTPSGLNKPEGPIALSNKELHWGNKKIQWLKNKFIFG